MLSEGCGRCFAKARKALQICKEDSHTSKRSKYIVTVALQWFMSLSSKEKRCSNPILTGLLEWHKKKRKFSTPLELPQRDYFFPQKKNQNSKYAAVADVSVWIFIYRKAWRTFWATPLDTLIFEQINQSPRFMRQWQAQPLLSLLVEEAVHIPNRLTSFNVLCTRAWVSQAF